MFRFILSLWRRLFDWLVPFAQRRCRTHGRHASGVPSSQRRSRKPTWVVQRVIRLKALMPDAGCRRIATTFNRPSGRTPP